MITLTHSHNDDTMSGNILFCGSLNTVGEVKHPYIYEFGGERSAPKVPRGSSESSYSRVLKKDKQYIVVVGSCGYPSGGDNRASYAIYDTESHEITFWKVPYNVDKTVGNMQRAGFPQKIINKVLHGV